MHQICPRGVVSEEDTIIFRVMFMLRLPKQVQVMLAEDRSTSVNELAAAEWMDQISSHALTPLVAINAIPEEEAVAPPPTRGSAPLPPFRLSGKNKHYKIEIN